MKSLEEEYREAMYGKGTNVPNGIIANIHGGKPPLDRNSLRRFEESLYATAKRVREKA